MLKNKIEKLIAKNGWTIDRIVNEINLKRNFVTKDSINNILKGNKETIEESEYLMSILTDIQIETL